MEYMELGIDDVELLPLNEKGRRAATVECGNHPLKDTFFLQMKHSLFMALTVSDKQCALESAPGSTIAPEIFFPEELHAAMQHILRLTRNHML